MGCSITSGFHSIMSSFGRRHNGDDDHEDYKQKLERKMYLARESPDTNFDLSDCNLKHVPSGIYSICKVFRKEHLNLHNNHLSSLDDGGKISDLELIKTLNISKNKFTKLPTDVCLLVNLKELYIGDNKIKSLPNTIGSMVSLKILDASNNLLTELPASVGSLGNLRKLFLRGNKDLKTLCTELSSLGNLRELDIDGNNFTYPPRDVAVAGTIDIMKYLCESCGIRYVPPSDEVDSVSNNSPPLLSPLEKSSAARNEYLSWEREEENLHRLECEMQEAAQKQKEKFLLEYTKEQMKIDSELNKIQIERDNERQRLIKQIHEEEQFMECLVLQLLELNNQNPMRIQQFLEHDQKEHDRLLEMCRANYSNIKTADTLNAMKSLLEEECQYDKSLKMYGDTQSEVRQSFLLTELISGQEVNELLKARGEIQSSLVEKLLHDEEVQKAAVGALLEKCDSRSWGLVQEITIVENHLAKLSAIEIGRKKLQLDDNLQNLADQRVKLSLLLVDLLEQQESRRTQLMDTLQAMELEKSTSPHFWLIRYQQLLDNLPEVVVSTQKQIDPLFANYLLQEGVIHCLPFLIRWVSSKQELSTITDAMLLEQGVILTKDRIGILRAAKLYLEEIDAERKKLGSSPVQSPVEMPSAPSPSLISESSIENDKVMTDTKENESECVICMENSCAVVFIPCGHLCCCIKCADTVQNSCPMCRSDIERRIRVVIP